MEDWTALTSLRETIVKSTDLLKSENPPIHTILYNLDGVCRDVVGLSLPLDIYQCLVGAYTILASIPTRDSESDEYDQSRFQCPSDAGPRGRPSHIIGKDQQLFFAGNKKKAKVNPSCKTLVNEKKEEKRTSISKLYEVEIYFSDVGIICIIHVTLDLAW